MSEEKKSYISDRIESELVGKMHDAELDALMYDVAALIHEFEWYESGNGSPKEYMKVVGEFKDKWFNHDDRAIVCDYIWDELFKLLIKLRDFEKDSRVDLAIL